MSYRVGIVGVGENARDHARACALVRQAELVSICDISEEALTRFGHEFGVSRRYSKLEEMLEKEDLDIVVVSTWGVSHAKISNAVASSGKVRAILCEKPISTTAAECREMIDVAMKHGVLLTEGFKFRYHPQFRRVKEIVESGRIGEIRAIQAILSSPLVRYVPKTNWRYYRDRGGGSVFDTASYLIHTARFIVGQEPQQVFARGTYIEGVDVEVSASIMLHFPGDVRAMLTSSYQYGYCQAMEILGTSGWIRMDLPFDQRSVREQEFVTREEFPAVVQVHCDRFDTEVHQFSPVNQFESQLGYLCECLRTGAPHFIPPGFSLGNMRAIEAVLQSIGTNRPVDLPSAMSASVAEEQG